MGVLGLDPIAASPAIYVIDLEKRLDTPERRHKDYIAGLQALARFRRSAFRWITGRRTFTVASGGAGAFPAPFLTPARPRRGGGRKKKAAT